MPFAVIPAQAGIQKKIVFLDGHSKMPLWRYFAGMTMRANNVTFQTAFQD
jgi:hypothetical protein